MWLHEKGAAPRGLSRSQNPSVTRSEQEVQGPLRGVKLTVVYVTKWFGLKLN